MTPNPNVYPNVVTPPAIAIKANKRQYSLIFLAASGSVTTIGKSANTFPKATLKNGNIAPLRMAHKTPNIYKPKLSELYASNFLNTESNFYFGILDYSDYTYCFFY